MQLELYITVGADPDKGTGRCQMYLSVFKTNRPSWAGKMHFLGQAAYLKSVCILKVISQLCCRRWPEAEAPEHTAWSTSLHLWQILQILWEITEGKHLKAGEEEAISQCPTQQHRTPNTRDDMHKSLLLSVKRLFCEEQTLYISRETGSEVCCLPSGAAFSHTWRLSPSRPRWFIRAALTHNGVSGPEPRSVIWSGF